MPLNLTKEYADLLELLHYPSEALRNASLLKIFQRDIEDNIGFNFRTKIIRPIKGQNPEIPILFKHLTTERILVEDENGKKFEKSFFEIDRSMRLHWIRYHIEEKKKENIEIFSAEERDQKRREDIIRTYIYDKDEKYVIVLDPQRSERDYYLVTAYHLNKDYGEKKIKKLLKNKLAEVH